MADITITVDGREWVLVPTDKLTFPEIREVKRVSGGMNLAQFEEGVAGYDADAWFAWIYVSIRREWPKLTVAELEHAIGDAPLAYVIGSVKGGDDDAPEVAPGPPAGGGTTPAPASSNGSEPTPEPSTPGTSGPPTSRIPT